MADDDALHEHLKDTDEYKQSYDDNRALREQLRKAEAGWKVAEEYHDELMSRCELEARRDHEITVLQDRLHHLSDTLREIEGLRWTDDPTVVVLETRRLVRGALAEIEGESDGTE